MSDVGSFTSSLLGYLRPSRGAATRGTAPPSVNDDLPIATGGTTVNPAPATNILHVLLPFAGDAAAAAGRGYPTQWDGQRVGAVSSSTASIGTTHTLREAQQSAHFGEGSTTGGVNDELLGLPHLYDVISPNSDLLGSNLEEDTTTNARNYVAVEEEEEDEEINVVEGGGQRSPSSGGSPATVAGSGRRILIIMGEDSLSISPCTPYSPDVVVSTPPVVVSSRSPYVLPAGGEESIPLRSSSHRHGPNSAPPPLGSLLDTRELLFSDSYRPPSWVTSHTSEGTQEAIAMDTLRVRVLGSPTRVENERSLPRPYAHVTSSDDGRRVVGRRSIAASSEFEDAMGAPPTAISVAVRSDRGQQESLIFTGAASLLTSTADMRLTATPHHRADSLLWWQVLLEEVGKLKWQMLPFMCLMTVGVYYTSDFPAAFGTGGSNTLQAKFLTEGKEYNQAMNQALYSVYSYPNTVLAIFGGLLIDKYIGLRKSMILFGTFVLMGSIMFYVSAASTDYRMLLGSRFVFGLGGECLFVAKSAFVARWFRGGRGMALAFGITISFSRVGSSLNFLISSRLARDYGVEAACLAGVAACVVSLVACVILILADVYAVKKGLIKAEAVGGDEKEGENVMKLSDILKLPLELWLICIICIFCYCAIFPFVGIAKNFFQVKYGLSGTEASDWLSLYSFVSAAASPVIGFVVDQTGCYVQWMGAASLSFTGVHLALYTMGANAYVGGAVMPLMGLGYSFLVCGLWPSVPYAVPRSMTGMAFGVITALQNFGLATVPLIIGWVLDAHTPLHAAPTSSDSHIVSSIAGTNTSPMPSIEGFELALMILTGLAFGAFLTSVGLFLVDTRRCCFGWSTAGAHVERLRGTHLWREGLLSSCPAERDALLLRRAEERRAHRKARRYNDEGVAGLSSGELHYCVDDDDDDDELNRTLPFLAASEGPHYLGSLRDAVVAPLVAFPESCLGARIINGCQRQLLGRCWKTSRGGDSPLLSRPKFLMSLCFLIIFTNSYFLLPLSDVSRSRPPQKNVATEQKTSLVSK